MKIKKLFWLKSKQLLHQHKHKISIPHIIYWVLERANYYQ